MASLNQIVQVSGQVEAAGIGILKLATPEDIAQASLADLNRFLAQTSLANEADAMDPELAALHNQAALRRLDLIP